MSSPSDADAGLGQVDSAESCSLGTAHELCCFLFRNTTGVTEEALKEFSMMFK